MATSRGAARRGKCGGKKALSANIEDELSRARKGGAAGPAHPLSCDRGLDDPSRQAFTRPFHPLFPHRVFPFDLTPCLKSYLCHRSTCPLSFHHCQPASAVTADEGSLFLLPYGLSGFFVNEYNRATTLHYRICLLQR